MKSEEEETKIKCSKCPKEFKYKSEKMRHEISHYQLFECGICTKKFNFQSALRRHQKQHDRTESVKCEKCNRKFRDEILLKRHTEYAHKGTFTCPKCSTTFHSKPALNTHMKTHQPHSERQYRCSHCDKTFNFSHHLKHHEMTHTNAKQHYCSVCGKGFIQSHHLKTHMRTHTARGWYYCEYPGCKKRFSSKYTRNQHKVTHGVVDSLDGTVSSLASPDITSNDMKEIIEDLMPNPCYGKTLPTFNSETDLDLEGVGDMNLENEDDSLKLEDNTEPTDDQKVTIDISDCKTVLGSCITDVDHCICEQINKTKKSDTDEIIDEIKKVNINEDTKIYAADKSNQRIAIEDIQLPNNACESCDCASICNDKAKMNCAINSLKYEDNNNTPIISCGDDGVIKIKDTFDIDFEVESDKFVPFGTCKDVIGKCIVGGNGEGCLCAKMIMDEEQAMAQEIEDITPHPKTDMA